MGDHNEAIQQNLSRFCSAMGELSLRKKRPDAKQVEDVEEGRTRMVRLLANINQCSANPVLKKETFLRSGINNPEEVSVDETDEVFQETEAQSEYQILKKKAEILATKIDEDLRELLVYNNQIQEITNADETIRHNEPIDENEQTRAQRRNVGLANILNVLSEAVSSKLTGEQQADIEELIAETLSDANQAA